MKDFGWMNIAGKSPTSGAGEIKSNEMKRKRNSENMKSREWNNSCDKIVQMNENLLKEMKQKHGKLSI